MTDYLHLADIEAWADELERTLPANTKTAATLRELLAIAGGVGKNRAVALVTRDRETWCRFCGKRVNDVTDWGHAPDCPFLRARRVMGYE